VNPTPPGPKDHGYHGPPVDRGLAVILTAVVGGLIALQAPINAGLGRATGSLPAALVSFLVGTLILAFIVAFSGHTGGLGSTFDVRWYYLIGGLLGAAYVTVALISVSTIGAGGVAAATITGQLTSAVVLDRLGVLGLEKVPLSATRLVGVALLLAGTYLVVR
jgi:transporter family-2 protein